MLPVITQQATSARPRYACVPADSFDFEWATVCQRSRFLSTGGTIASASRSSAGRLCSRPCQLWISLPLFPLFEQLKDRNAGISNMSSSDMTPQVWLQLSTRINELLSRDGIAGAVVTHGTNTLEETAYFLDLTITSLKPVVLVGAQRPASDPDADGPRNLLDAIRVATLAGGDGQRCHGRHEWPD